MYARKWLSLVCVLSSLWSLKRHCTPLTKTSPILDICPPPLIRSSPYFSLVCSYSLISPPPAPSKGLQTEKIEWFIEDQAFSPLYALTPSPLLSNDLPSASCLSFSVFLCVAGRAYWREGGGAGAKVLSSINHSILSVCGFLPWRGQEVVNKERGR
jgi:hypothetical protein